MTAPLDENRPLDDTEADALRAIVEAQENDSQSDGVLIGLSCFKTVENLNAILKNDQLVEYRQKGFNAKARALLAGKKTEQAGQVTEQAIKETAPDKQPRKSARRRPSLPYRRFEGPY